MTNDQRNNIHMKVLNNLLSEKYYILTCQVTYLVNINEKSYDLMNSLLWPK